MRGASIAPVPGRYRRGLAPHRIALGRRRRENRRSRSGAVPDLDPLLRIEDRHFVVRESHSLERRRQRRGRRGARPLQYRRATVVSFGRRLIVGNRTAARGQPKRTGTSSSANRIPSNAVDSGADGEVPHPSASTRPTPTKDRSLARRVPANRRRAKKRRHRGASSSRAGLADQRSRSPFSFLRSSGFSRSARLRSSWSLASFLTCGCWACGCWPCGAGCAAG